MNPQRELAVKIVGLFEELLNENNMTIPNKERIGDGLEARIFGETYYTLEDQIVELLPKNKEFEYDNQEPCATCGAPICQLYEESENQISALTSERKEPKYTEQLITDKAALKLLKKIKGGAQ